MNHKFSKNQLGKTLENKGFKKTGKKNIKKLKKSVDKVNEI